MATPDVTPFGQFLLDRMKEVGYETRADLARAAELGQATLARLVHSSLSMPDTRTFEQLAVVLDVPVPTLLEAWSKNPPRDLPAPRAMDPLAVEITNMLDVDSPIRPEDLAVLKTLLDRVVDPYRKVMRRRRKQ